ncbi:N-acetyltransferase [Asanoa sp. WMMD1127]|uniref:GNAT family N-acetyltransferase n=1 Tax=Asanoa sp. WMMD1127 TaxID=3016107 RepID=UPI0024164824|nr:N-acetyltransferase [Asanoa sp. WMMD1127]MDG4825622.1 N-acetyltransferase [Asanoa sp. WMMD1127]
MSTTPRVRPASATDVPALKSVIAAAFMADPIADWIFRDEATRHAEHLVFFGAFVDLALAAGTAETVDDHKGLALWLDVDVDAPEPEDDGSMGAAFEAGLDGETLKRVGMLDELMAAGHPHDRSHAYLPFIAVHPEHQGAGVGAALLRHRLAELDAAGRPAYLEASNLRNAALYERLGFARLPRTIDLPEGPSLYPMWRDPR